MVIGKRRTRQHIIADLGINHVERHALLAGFTVERVAHDYGVDMFLTTYDRNGEVEPGYVYLQVKATDHLIRLASQRISFPVSERDLKLWRSEFHPMILVLYDAHSDRASWVHIRGHFARLWESEVRELRAFRSILFPRRSSLGVNAMMTFADLKRKLYFRMQGLRDGK